MEDRRQHALKWLAEERRNGMPYGVQVSVDAWKDFPRTPLGCCASAVVEDGWRAVIFSHAEERDAYRASLPEGSTRDDPMDTTRIAGD